MVGLLWIKFVYGKGKPADALLRGRVFNEEYAHQLDDIFPKLVNLPVRSGPTLPPQHLLPGAGNCWFPGRACSERSPSRFQDQPEAPAGRCMCRNYP